MDSEEDCKCIKITGHLDAVKWSSAPRQYRPSAGPLVLGDWTQNYHIWLYYVESSHGLLVEDDVLKSTHTKFWSIHDVQRYFLGEMHCEQVLFTYQYPNLKMPTALGSYLWKANAALKLPPKLYLKELHMTLECTLKKLEANQTQIDRLILSDQLIKIDRLDNFKRRTFFRLLNNIIGFQESLQLVSLENLCCKRLEGVRIIQQLACFAAHTLKYLFLWRFVLPNENPILINFSYITALLVLYPSVKLVCFFIPCAALLGMMGVYLGGLFSYYTDVAAAKVNMEKKIKCEDFNLNSADPKRPWRTHSNKEKLLRVDNELKQHNDRAGQAITPLGDDKMQELLKECQEENIIARPVRADRLRETVEEARKNLPNFQYRRIENSTATAILPSAPSFISSTPTVVGELEP